ncbi:MAG: hypothetical protein AB7Q37_18215 [Pyrinomonadaceae bacterium]
MTKLRFAFLILSLSQASLVLAQADDEAAKERRRQKTVLAEAIIGETRELRLPENRSLVLARTGIRLWSVDQEKARELFNEAANELIAAVNLAEAERKRNPQFAYAQGQMPRPQVLDLIAQKDADLALKAFYRTRTPDVERALAARPAADQRIRNVGNNDVYLVQNELNLEQRLIRAAADQNPEKAIEFLKAALKRGVGPEVVNLLRKLHEKDAAAAATLGREAIGQLVQKNYAIGNQPDHSAFQAAFQVLNDSVRQRPATDKSFNFAIADIRALFDKLLSIVTDLRSTNSFQYAQQLASIAEKFRPETVARLREASQRAPYAPFRSGQADLVRRLSSTDTPVDQAMAEAARLDAESRRTVYQSVANRFVQGGDMARARQIIGEHFADTALSSAQEALDYQYVHYLINQGKFQEAESLIDEFPDHARFNALISLADGAFSRDQKENQPLSVRILQKARAGLPDRPEDSLQLQHMLRLVNAYVRIEPIEAFNIAEGLIQQINELSEASVVVNGFQSSHAVRMGEIVMINGGNVLMGMDYSFVRGLAQKDFDRTVAMIRAFSRRETRAQLTLNLLESYP